MDWDHIDTAPRQPQAAVTVLGADLGEVFLEDTKHRRSEGAAAGPAALAGALSASRDLLLARSALPAVLPAAGSGDGDGDPAPAPPADRLHGACRRALAGTMSAGVELLVCAGGVVGRMVPGATRCDPVLALTPDRREAILRALAAHGAGLDDPWAVAVVAYPLRLVLAAGEAGVTCPPSRAYRRTLVEAGALLEAVSNEMAAAGFEPEPRLHFFDDELDDALALDGIAEVVVAVLLITPGAESST